MKLHAKQALVWSLAVTTIAIMCIPPFFFCIGFVLLPGILVLNIVFSIIGMVKTKKGKKFLYPLVANWL